MWRVAIVYVVSDFLERCLDAGVWVNKEAPFVHRFCPIRQVISRTTVKLLVDKPRASDDAFTCYAFQEGPEPGRNIESIGTSIRRNEAVRI